MRIPRRIILAGLALPIIDRLAPARADEAGDDAESLLRLELAGDRWMLTNTLTGEHVFLSAMAPVFDFGAFQLGGPPAGRPEWEPRERGWEAAWTVARPRRARITGDLTMDPRTGVLRRQARIELLGGEKALLRRVVIDHADAPGQQLVHRPGIQSHPAFGRSFFFGIEFPMAAVRADAEQVELAHAPGRWVHPGEPYRSRSAVFGASAAGKSREAFERYIASLRPAPHGIHFNYNSWWTSPVPYTEADILKIIEEFRRNLFAPYGVSPDSFCIDMGWAKNTTLWGIDPALFPQGFARLQEACRNIRSRLGLWISPSGVYGQALDLAWAKRAGYEADSKACLAGPRYRAAFSWSLSSIARRYRLGHVKFDGYVPTCDAPDHGHEPGALSAEPIAEGMIEVFGALRRTVPDVWMEPTCFGPDSSPWWLAHANSVTGAFGDDAPHGRVPCPVYRESYTTGRDYYNLKGARDIPFPIAAQEVLGIIHQTPEPFENDAVDTVMRGNQFVSLYVNPADMTPRRWEFMAALMKWAKRNQSVLSQTRPILPDSWRKAGGGPGLVAESAMPREPYGYGHWSGDRGLVCLRNPWIEPAEVTLSATRDCGAPEGRKIDAVCVYPTLALLSAGHDTSRPLSVRLAPYETAVIELGPPRQRPLPRREEPIPPDVNLQVRASRLDVAGSGPAFGPDYTRLLTGPGPYLRARLDGRIQLRGQGHGELLLLIEGPEPVEQPLITINASGTVVTPAVISSESGWRATGRPAPEHWLWLVAPLLSGPSAIEAEVTLGQHGQTLAGWVVEREAVSWRRLAHVDGGALPPPEERFITSTRAFAPIALTSDLPVVREESPVERIRGVYLDSLEPASVTQGWGTLQKNRSVWEKPLTVGGRRFLRGLGTHAPSRIVYNLAGRYRRFQAWAGADQATAPTITMQVKADGRTVWQSGLLTRESPAQRVDVDVSGAQRLELIVGDGGNGMNADHADWADAILTTGQ